MSDGNEDDVDMAECGVCRTVVPISSENCPECGVAFTGVSDEALGECGACKALIPLNSESCTQCGVTFVADNVIKVLGNWLSATGLSTRDLFEKFDTDGDGQITSEEFKNGLLSLKLADLPPSQIDRLVTAIDEDGNGVIDLDELSNTFAETNEPLKDIAEKEVEEGAEETDSSKTDSADDSPVEEDEKDESDEKEDSEGEEDKSDDGDDDSEEEDKSDDSDDDSEEEDKSDDSDDDSEEEDADDDGGEDDAFTRFGKAVAAAGYSIREVFERLDTNEDGRIDGPELQKGLADILGENLVAADVFAILKTIDKDDDGYIDAMEIIEALEKLDLDLESDKTDVAAKKEFPSQLQKFLMGKTANDIFFPICYFLAFAFITIWIVNGLGLIVDGTGGNVVYSGHTDAYGIEWDQADYNICTIMPDLSNCQGYVTIGDSYPCDPAINDDACANSLTPFMEYSSMPAGFYGDGIFMIILGFFGIGAILFLHLVYSVSLRARVRSLRDEDKEYRSEEVDEAIASDEEEDSGDDAEDDSKESGDDVAEEDDDADIDIGSQIGLVLEDEEFFGVIIEFDDDEELVTIETEDGEEITGYQNDMFIE
jgi:Ca2+-binding EF-hand superfamily protein/RNA polymerase subunit RPABC4/transcription elongation factor Spt4/uncharacterized membrane protein